MVVVSDDGGIHSASTHEDDEAAGLLNYIRHGELQRW